MPAPDYSPKELTFLPSDSGQSRSVFIPLISEADQVAVAIEVPPGAPAFSIALVVSSWSPDSPVSSTPPPTIPGRGRPLPTPPPLGDPGQEVTDSSDGSRPVSVTAGGQVEITVNAPTLDATATLPIYTGTLIVTGQSWQIAVPLSLINGVLTSRPLNTPLAVRMGQTTDLSLRVTNPAPEATDVSYSLLNASELGITLDSPTVVVSGVPGGTHVDTPDPNAPAWVPGSQDVTLQLTAGSVVPVGTYPLQLQEIAYGGAQKDVVPDLAISVLHGSVSVRPTDSTAVVAQQGDVVTLSVEVVTSGERTEISLGPANPWPVTASRDGLGVTLAWNGAPIIDQGTQVQVLNLFLRTSRYAVPQSGQVTATWSAYDGEQSGVLEWDLTITPGAFDPPKVALTARPSTIAPGQGTTLLWTAEFVDSLTINPDVGSIATDDRNSSTGSKIVHPAGTTAYTIVGKGPGRGSAPDGADVKTALVTVATPQPHPGPKPPTGEPPRPPQPLKGPSQVIFINQTTDAHTLNLWWLDVTAGTGWLEAGTLAFQEQHTFKLEDGHGYTMAALDSQLPGCDPPNDPTLFNCVRLKTGVLVGDSRNPTPSVFFIA